MQVAAVETGKDEAEAAEETEDKQDLPLPGHGACSKAPATDEMQDNVFECHDEQNDRRQFAKTMEEHLQIYAKKKIQH